jgi:hypothetical protein
MYGLTNSEAMKFKDSLGSWPEYEVSPHLTIFSSLMIKPTAGGTLPPCEVVTHVHDFSSGIQIN